MKLKDMKKKPTKAGIAEINWVEDKSGYGDLDIRREGDKIYLPDYPEHEFIPLQGGKQFLFRNRSLTRFWFGGTDENSFLVRITSEAFASYKKSGAKAFYEFLKPATIRYLEKRFKRVKAKRQGDIWAFPIPVSWKTLDLLGDLLYDFKYIIPPKTKSNMVFGTRHEIDGRYNDSEDGLNDSPMAFVEGTLTSPNHKSLKLKGLHILVQTNGLEDDVEAD